jgi:predicted acylesterase/phospholipase RssA
VLLAFRPVVSPGGAPVRQDRAVVVAASGGGTQAAAWTARVLSGLDAECGHSCAFSESIALISGTSGGAVGGMFVAQGYEGGSLRASYEQLRDQADRSTEDALWRTLIYRDVFGWLRRLVTTRDDDRGLAVEHVWEDAMGARPWLSTFQEDARRGRRPGLVFTTAQRDTGAPLLISTAGRAANREDFLATYAQRNIPVARAARLSAAFPVVTPLPNDDPGIAAQRLVDGGVADLFGVDAAVQWLGTALEDQTVVRRVLLLQIEAPQETGYSLIFSNRASEQRARNELAIRNLGLSLHGAVDLQVVSIPLEDEPSIAWHLTRAQRDSIDAGWSRLKSGDAVRRVLQFLTQ